MVDKLDAEMKFGQEALNLRGYRQEVLSSNIANADTPGYEARDMDFSKTLTTALKKGGHDESGQSGLQLVTDDVGHIAGQAQGTTGNGFYGQLAYRNPVQQSLDGNTVDLDTERVNFADNSLHYETGMTVLTGQIKAMLAAITQGT
ncbi:flagellar basal body rod protein FlgB [Pararobbsia silviterrae]|uniref:Flagellar basal body rod protein FlgB n=1 Tax=Pararobbsia silviterrae TaxID=1792498 RepID=A0A494XBA2_9BURK|nr:flagellar basal body rod protein FlgB [Pararobbsia silviterrae]RKP45389.1 flagellar basal body rod protein FlgB [Pararobbsia silviterrae]